MTSGPTLQHPPGEGRGGGGGGGGGGEEIEPHSQSDQGGVPGLYSTLSLIPIILVPSLIHFFISVVTIFDGPYHSLARDKQLVNYIPTVLQDTTIRTPHQSGHSPSLQCLKRSWKGLTFGLYSSPVHYWGTPHRVG